MTTGDVTTLYETAIAPLPQRDQLLLASTILSRLTDEPGRAVTKEVEDEILRKQQIALQAICGIADGGSADASVRHDDIIYGPKT